MAVSWKIGALPQQVSANLVDLQTNARNFYNNRFDIIDNAIANLQSKKARGEITDLQFVTSLNALSSAQQRAGYTENDKAVTDLSQQAQEASAKQVYQDYIDTQKRNIQNTINAAETIMALTQDDFEKGKISLDAYKAQLALS